MDGGGELSLWLLFGVYFFVFCLFLRYLWWKYEAERRYWNNRKVLTEEQLLNLAQSKDRQVPYYTILVPARGEAMVVANTVRHLTALQYPRERFEIMVITDEKEDIAWSRGEQEGPTTRQVVEQLIDADDWSDLAPQIKVVSVPYDFDGRLDGRQLGHEVKSTKGRALNYGLGFLDPRTEICAFYDAESRPEPQVLLYVAARYLMSRQEQIWYGPVFQVRNFYHQGSVSRIGSLFQCAAHQWYIPALLKCLPFVGGTNLFATRQLVEQVNGYDSSTLTEDVEFGVRVYCLTGHWPVYIPYWSTEQTPASYRSFFRQRLRWGSGHLQVTEKFRRSYGLYPEARRQQMVQALFWKGEGEWLFFQGVFLLTICLAVVVLAGLLDITTLPWAVLALLRGFGIVYMGFTGYLYLHYRPFMEPDRGVGAILASRARFVLELVLLPLLCPFLLLPYTWALLLKWANRPPQAWVKTPRTIEASR